MKRITTPALMIMALLLSGCAKNDVIEKNFEDERLKWSQSQSLSFTADIVTELDDTVFECTLLCSREGEDIVLEVQKPENIAGIKAKLKDSSAQIEYDGIILAVENASIGEISPISGAAKIMRALTKSPLAQIWTEKYQERELIVTEVYISESEYARLWFLKENFSLIHAELVSGGRSVVKCNITSFTKE